MSDIPLRWLDGAPACPSGIAFGVPFPRGAVARGAPWHLVRADGQAIPTQCWPLAWWPDGSVKWLACAAMLGPADGDGLRLRPGPGPAPARPVTVRQIGIEIFRRVCTGAITVDVGDRGTAIIQEISRHRGDGPPVIAYRPHGLHDGGLDRIVAGTVQLVCQVEQRSIGADAAVVLRREAGLGVVRSLVVEQEGPVRAVLRLDGLHRMDASRREWLPFTLRLVFWAGSDAIDAVHSIVFDGDPQRDFICGLGLRCAVPLLDGPDNRHMRFAGAADAYPIPVWCEAARYAHTSSSPARQAEQIAARRVEPRGEDLLLPVWDAFRLEQESADHAVIRKRQAGPVCWIDAAHGRRAAGLAAMSDPGGGLALGIEDFWESFPAALEADGFAGSAPTLTAWLWSDRAPPMDLRHYGTRDHRPVYEAVNPDPQVYSNAHGIARTSRLRLRALPPETAHADLAACAAVLRRPPLLVCPPERYAQTRVFGPVGVAARDTPARAAIEDELDAAADYLRGQIEARRWYGFWNWGDVMHSYDEVRRVWRYDIGGYAWNNAELATDLWLWHAFIRGGRAADFRFAVAMTRHVSEVDSFHLGIWKGQGSRHNVVHWGCPCKEPRVSSALPKRFLHYLTADERIGDLLAEVADAHLGRATNVPADPARWEARIGPTWAAFCGNWLAAWERSGDRRWRDLIAAGIRGILASPHRLLTGTPFAFDSASGAMTYAGDHPYASNMLVTLFGGAEAWMELAELLDDPAFAAAVAEYGRIHALPPEEESALPESLRRTLSLRVMIAKLAAWAAARDGDAALADRVWTMLLDGDGFPQPPPVGCRIHPLRRFVPPLSGETIDESGFFANHGSQWALNVLAALDLARDGLERVWSGSSGRPHGS